VIDEQIKGILQGTAQCGGDGKDGTSTHFQTIVESVSGLATGVDVGHFRSGPQKTAGQAKADVVTAMALQHLGMEYSEFQQGLEADFPLGTEGLADNPVKQRKMHRGRSTIQYLLDNLPPGVLNQKGFRDIMRESIEVLGTGGLEQPGSGGTIYPSKAANLSTQRDMIRSAIDQGERFTSEAKRAERDVRRGCWNGRPFRGQAGRVPPGLHSPKGNVLPQADQAKTAS
jgi:hypothetical protein